MSVTNQHGVDCRRCRWYHFDEYENADVCTEYTDGDPTSGAYYCGVYRSGNVARGCGPAGRYFERAPVWTQAEIDEAKREAKRIGRVIGWGSGD